MAGNEIRLKSISELLGMNFFIPSYQRGYRWDRQQIKDLLNDIYSFAIKKNKSDREFYCLQPVVVKKCSFEDRRRNHLQSNLDNNEWYEVIDGQQRLTTIRIILAYLVQQHLRGAKLVDDYGKSEFVIDYETRRDTKKVFENMEGLNSEETIDLYFIRQAYNAISEWFEKPDRSQRSVRESMLNTFVLDMDEKKEDGVVQVIWYEINDDDNDKIKPIDTFIRINMGKIPLTNAELIKALLLQKRNFGEDNIAELRQIEISNEWDRIEYALQNDDFWWFLNKNENRIPARIDFLFDLIYRINNSDSETKYGTDKYTAFRYFNDKILKNPTFENIKVEWDNIKDYFYAFDEWYNKPVWFHYIGFLIYCGVNILEIYKLYQDRKKDEFTEELKKKIKEQIKNIVCEKQGEDYRIHLPFESQNKDKIRKLLLLFNIEFIVKKHVDMMAKNRDDDNDYFVIKFPFELFKKEKWDIEHIDSQTPNEKGQKEWLEMAQKDLMNEMEKRDKKLLDDINKFIELPKPESFEKLYKRITKFAGEEENDSEMKNSIGNLTLLNSDINRSYGNALFPTKRRIIIEKDMEGKFIPICTKHVFLKYFDHEGASRTQWGEKDMNNYQNHICKTLEEFLTFQQEKNHE
jgi:uncharacterized protein with ParB-like and HNH nuclease domain